MSSRLDRLLLLLDTGSNISVRNTAAKQLAQLAAKSVTGDAAIEEDVKHSRHHPASRGDPSSWKELMSVVARILPFLHSKSFETRTAASVALSHIFSLVPLWEPCGDVKPDVDMDQSTVPDYPAFSVQELMQKGTLLLASSGKEFLKPTGILASADAVQKARQEAMGRLGLEFLEGDELDLGKELEDSETPMDVDEAIKTEDDGPPTSPTSVEPPPEEKPKPGRAPPRNRTEPVVSVPSAAPSTSSAATSPAAEPTEDDLSQLSARERNRLKRKRKPGNSAFVAAPPPQASGSKYAATPAGPSNKVRLVATDEAPTGSSSRVRSGSPAPNGKGNGVAADKVVIDPSKGGAVEAKAAAQQQSSKALDVVPGTWIWDGVVRMLEVELFSAAWEARHGAAMALRELLKVQGKCGGMKDDSSDASNAYGHERWCNDLSAKFLCVFVLDRFGDFVSDQVVAPVRETVSQTLASLLIHMPRRSVSHVHTILLSMIRQDFVLANGSASTNKLSLPGRGSQDKGPEQGHVWEVRHAGLLGIKYEVAVRSDLFEIDATKQEGEFDAMGKDVLAGLVDAAVLGLGDRDDDVRAVAASCLLPVAGHLVKQQPESLERVLVVLWSCLGNMKDDLSSSVGAVMDLLGKLVGYDAVIAILANPDQSLPLTSLAPTLFPFFRHTIANVRLAVVKTLLSFMTVPSLSREWIAAPFLQLLLQNLVCEERSDIRDASLAAWKEALVILSSRAGWMESVVTQSLILEWYAIVMTPLGSRVESAAFYRPSTSEDGLDAAPERHNVDKNMLEQDFSLITIEVTLKARIAASTALAELIAYWPAVDGVLQSDPLFEPILAHYIDSTSMLQKLLAAVITEQWARTHDALMPGTALLEKSPLAMIICNKTLAFLQADPPASYHEMAPSLFTIFTDCRNILHSFAQDCKLPISSIPYLGTEIDMTGDPNTDKFTIDKASTALTTQYKVLEKTLGRTKKKELAAMAERKANTLANIERYKETKNQHDVRVSAAFAAAFVSLRSAPGKVSPVVKGVMNGVKNEENIDLQTRSAVAVASFVDFCVQNNLPQPPDKIVKNLCTFLCQDTEKTPTFAFTRKLLDGILSFQAPTPSTPAATKGKDKAGDKDLAAKEAAKAESASKTRLSRRGAGLAFVKLSETFGPKLLDTVPNMWQSMVGGLLSTCTAESPEAMDKVIEQVGQDVIDSLSVLEAVVPTLHPDLRPKLVDIYPMMTLALQSRFAIVRQAAARCFAIVCDVMTSDAMQYVIQHVIPLLGDALVLSNRQGATELIYHIVQRLDIKALPYVIFMVVPVLGRMSDSDDDIRSTATNTFASLVKMVPLEAGLPDPPGFPEELLKRRDTERQFLSQLLDGNKVQEYTIPIPIKAELRKYQQEGVSWLAFLAKYQLHGILCDDMGLGKTLQSICILSSKHFERAERYKELKTPDAIHLPSLIVCPPTLTGHWFYEIQKYAENLRPVLYTGNARERIRLLSKLKNFDVVITSYEVVRNDIASLGDVKFLYCILDEGHIIKNPKTKLTKAVKCIQAQHRVLLSGTPIQNNVLELWSLFDFLMPGFLGTEASFNERFGKPIVSHRDGKTKNGEAAALALEALHKQVLPFLLRRLKEDVLHDLPPKIIQDYYCELSDLQKYLYDDFSKSTMRTSAQDVVKSEGKGETQHVFQSLQYLRKLCNHPLLVLKNEPEATAAALEKIGSKEGLRDLVHAPKLLALRLVQLLTECGIGSSLAAAGEPKAEADVLTESPDTTISQHRVLIFCQMKQMLDIIEKDLFQKHMPSVTYMRLDGNTDASKRHDVVQTFNADPSIDVLLLTTHVGGLGLTLTGADTVIFVEHDWNPSKDVQAMDRAHRIGQKKVVNVYRLITKGTLEEKIMGLQRFKLNIANSVITQQNSGLDSMDTDRVLDLFKRTTDEEDSAAQKKATTDASGPASQKNVLQGLEDLPEEDEYEGMDLSSFMGSLGR